jgi:ZIP family zinc transporter
MLVETMIPEGFEGTHDFSGPIAATGFLASFALSMLGG